MGDFFQTDLQSQLRLHGLTEDDLHGWAPPLSAETEAAFTLFAHSMIKIRV